VPACVARRHDWATLVTIGYRDCASNNPSVETGDALNTRCTNLACSDQMSIGDRHWARRAGNSAYAPITRPIIPITVSAGFRDEVIGFPFEALPILVLGFAVRIMVAFAINGLLRLRFALNIAVDRRLDLVLLAFLAMDSPVGVCGEVVLSQRTDAGASCAFALAAKEGRRLWF